MSKLYVPEGVWLVCSEGTSTQQLAVVSQSTVKIDGAHLMATTEDRVKTDFGCKKGAFLAACMMALAAMAVAVVIVGTGGLGACAIIGAAGAAGAIGGGILGRLMPCGCATCMGVWQNHSLSVKAGGYHALLEDSFSLCSKGGTIKIMFSKEAAEAYAALVAAKSNVEIANVAVIAFIAPFVLQGAGNAILGFKSGFSAALGVSKLSAAAFVGETTIAGGTGLVTDLGLDFVKENLVYEKLGVKTYTKGAIEDETITVLGNNSNDISENQGNLFDTKQSAEYSKHIGDRENISITDYEKMTYEREGYLSTTNGYVDERCWEIVEEKSDWKYRIKGKRSMEALLETDKLTQSSGIYYMKDKYTLLTGKDYNWGRSLITDMKNSFNNSIPIKSKEGTKSFLFGLLLDAYRGIGNKLLEGSLNNYKKTIVEELLTRSKLKVKTK
ncbi:PAAR-like protein [uncultured Prevotella sp.]|uniref:PAAR-like protein n=1 Tax=uncultured Prevotella sp. TaxID=159272 RepID=UPI0027D9789C|nr:PAAR-like protein [uncultured Prevotella sp.]